MTQYSYSRVDTYKQCPRKYRYRYIDHLKTIPDDDAANPLWLGSALHKAIETDVETAEREYLDHYHLINDQNINWMIQLEYWAPKVKELLPPGENEVKIDLPDYIGFIDYLTEDSIFDFKWTTPKAHDRYCQSAQLHVYKYFLEKAYPEKHIDHLYYVFVPKSQIRQKKTETIIQFRDRLKAEMRGKEIVVKEIEYDEKKAIDFLQQCDIISVANEFEKNETPLCGWCDYQKLCQEGIEIDMQLPKAERRQPSGVTKRTIWLYGRPFTGKTTLADNAPMPLMLNTDGNVHYVTAPYISIKDGTEMDGRKIVHHFGWEVFKDVIMELEKKDNDYKTIVVDLLDDLNEMARLCMYDKLGITHESDDSYRAWDKVRTEFLSTMRRFMNLDYENIILISHEDSSRDLTKKSGENITAIKPNIADKLASKIAGMVDIVGRVVVDGDTRTIQFNPDEVVFGGGRLNIKEKEIPLDWNEVVRIFDEANENMLGGKN